MYIYIYILTTYNIPIYTYIYITCIHTYYMLVSQFPGGTAALCMYTYYIDTYITYTYN